LGFQGAKPVAQDIHLGGQSHGHAHEAIDGWVFEKNLFSGMGGGHVGLLS
jgi:hypothetical protein